MSQECSVLLLSKSIQITLKAKRKKYVVRGSKTPYLFSLIIGQIVPPHAVYIALLLLSIWTSTLNTSSVHGLI